MYCNIMICTHNNAKAHYDVTMNILSDVIMGHETKRKCPPCDSVHYVIVTKCSVQRRISTGDLGMEIPFKSGHSIITLKLPDSTTFMICFIYIFYILHIFVHGDGFPYNYYIGLVNVHAILLSCY